MINELFSNDTFVALRKGLDVTSLRQQVIANNIANAETPGYKRSYVSFEDELKRVMEEGSGQSRRRALAELAPLRRTDTVSPSRPDGNNVNIDAEISELAKTGLKQRAAAVLLEGKISMLRAAISEGKR